MAVPEQTPYIEHNGNGVTTSFSLGFQCESKDHLIVLVDEVEPPIETWGLSSGNVVFTTAPAAGKKITIQRNTPFGRTTNYQSFNNSFRPQTVNIDFDRIWWKLQELGVADWLMKLYVDRLHQQQEQKINNLKVYVDDRDDELRAYLMEEIRKQGVALDQLDEYYNYLMQRLAQIAVDKGWDASFVVDGDKTQKQINDELRIFSTPKMFGAKGDGITDDTAALQEMFDQKGLIVIPDGTYLVSDQGRVSVNKHNAALQPKSNSVIYFSAGAKIKLAPNAEDRCMTLFIDRQNNIEIHCPHIIGDRFEHLGTTGEHAHGIGIFGGSNITLHNPTVTEAWGDGIYISGNYTQETGVNPKDIKIYGGQILKNSRNGISISGVDGLLIDGTVLENNDRTAPMAGIDIEPRETMPNKVKNVIIKKCVARGGASGFLALFNDTIQPDNSVTISDCISEGAATAGFVFGSRNPNDEIIMKNIITRDCGGFALSSPHIGNAGVVKIEGVTGINCNKTISGSMIEIGNTNSRAYSMGNVHISGIVADSPLSQQIVYLREVSSNVTNHGSTKNVTVSIDMIKSGNKPFLISDNVACKLVANGAGIPIFNGDENNAEVSIGGANGIYLTYRNAVTRRNTFKLPAIAYKYGLELTFEASEFGDVIVTPNAADKINFKNLTAGQYLRSRDKQARITLRATEAGWVVTAMVGEWITQYEPQSKTTTATYNPPSLAAFGTVGDSATTNVTLSGAKVGDVVQAAFSQYNPAIRIYPEVSAVDTVTVELKNTSAAPIDLPSGTLTVKLS